MLDTGMEDLLMENIHQYVNSNNKNKYYNNTQ